LQIGSAWADPDSRVSGPLLPYRPHIDGLRAIAVLAVILFHFSSRALPGGFLGVDIFFVISGFLITQLLSEPSDLSWRSRLGSFYLRRARRILPALIFTSLVVAAAAAVIFLPDDLRRNGKYFFLTPLMLANVASLLDGGYFATGNYFALRHYWSLAVEEQFYLVYPLVLFLPFAAQPRRRISVLAAIAVVSVALCIRGNYWHPSVTFYLMPARAWELMFGALAAASPPLVFKSRRAAEGAAYAALAVVLSSFVLFDQGAGLPNPRVLLPCAATAWLLFIGRQPSATAFQLLSMRPFVFTGKISYSLYLWHLPILVLAQYYAIRSLSVTELTAVGCAIYAVAVASWLFVENPIRRKVVFSSARTFIPAALAASLMVSALGAWFSLGKGLPWRVGRDIQVLTQWDSQPEQAVQCMTLPLTRVAAGDLCRIGPEHTGVRKAVLWGDSHALVLWSAFESLAQSNDVQIYFAGRSGCKPLLGVADGLGGTTKQENCAAFNDAMAAAVQKIHPEVTILAAFWDVESALLEQGLPALASTQARGWNWNSTLDPLRAAGSAMCVVFDVPYLRYWMPYALAMARRRGLDTSFINMTRAEVVARYKNFEAPVRALASVNALRVVDPKDALCPGERCEIEWNGRSLYDDYNHLSKVGAMHVRDSLAPCFQGNTGKWR
jgi:peptidoglycan/LPS O-acetylase OafA/YrhL